MESPFLPTGPKLLEFAAESEPWTQYRLENGAILRVRVIVTKVIDGGQRAPNGLPVYKVDMQQLMDMTFPDHMVAEAESHKQDNGHG